MLLQTLRGFNLLYQFFYAQSGDREPRPQLITAGGAQYELYEPKTEPRKNIVMIYGLTAHGEEDARLIRFARGLASTGMRVIVPILDGMKMLNPTTVDVETARECVSAVIKKHSEPLNIFATSAGGSIATYLSADRELAEHIKTILMLSPIYEAREVWNRLNLIAREPMNEPRNEDNQIWARSIVAFRNWQKLGYSEQEQLSMKEFLRQYLRIPMPDKKTFYRQVVAPREAEIEQTLDEVKMLETISVRGKLSNTKARVLVIHDVNDFLVPATQAQDMFNELAQRGHSSQRALITPALNHVSFNGLGNIKDIFKIADIFGELYA